MQLPNYLSNTYWLLLGIWIIISALLIYAVVDNFYDFIYNDTDLSTGLVAAATMISVFILTFSFLVFLHYFLQAKYKDNIDNYRLHLETAIVISSILIVISFITMCMLDAYYTDSDIIEIKQLLINKFETEQCDRKLELLDIYKNTTLNDLNNIETNLQLYKKLFIESDINELESNYIISCLDSNDLINQFLK